MTYTSQHKARYDELIELETKIENTFIYREMKPLILCYLTGCNWFLRKNAGVERLLYALVSRCIQLEKRNIGLEIKADE